MLLDFDCKQIITAKNDTQIEYGIINGGNKILFIKTGRDGSIYGYENKYLKIGSALKEKYNCSVIVSSNPFIDYGNDTNENPLSQVINFIKSYSAKMDFRDFEVYYMGISAGANDGAMYCHLYPEIKKTLLINSPIRFNTVKQIDGAEKFSGEKMFFVYGEKDPSTKYLQFFDEIKNEKVQIVTVPNADHQFTGMVEEFCGLPEMYLW